ncbi:MAG: GAF domain-containing protein [Planctomycetes bacterium]|nr:GAF domain-containing protein [Planctomycetota bacterium]
MPIIPLPTFVSDQPRLTLVRSEALLSAASTVEEVVFQLAGAVWFRLGYSAGQLWLPEVDTGRLLRVARWQPEVGTKPSGIDDRIVLLEKGQGLAGLAFERFRAEWVGRYTLSKGKPRPEHRVCTPLQGPGIVIGVLELVSEQVAEPTASRLTLLEQLGRRIGSFLHRMGA